MQHSQSLWQNRRGITVLALLLLIIAVVILAFFLIRYLGTGTAPAPEVPTESSFHQPLDQLNLSGVVEIVRRDPMDLLGVGPYTTG
jgi:hypothetical protein